MRIDGKIALITGSTGSGMGRSTAFTLANRGADIVLNYGTSRTDSQTQADAEKVATAIRAMGRRVLLVQADTKSEDDVRAMVAQAQEELGPIDILVNNAGGAWHVRDYLDIPHQEWRDVLAAEIDGAFLTMKHLVPGMRERGWGRVVHIGMTNPLGLVDMKGLAPDYCLGKAVRAWMTTAFGLQEFSAGVTVNCIEPGLTAHMALDDALAAAKGDYSQWSRRAESTAHDIAEIVAFLCSDAGRFISGSLIRLPTDK